MSKLLANLNPAQQAAVQHQDGPAVVLAGAGSGKTTVLTHRAAWLIQEKGVDASNIILVTFTNKAAGEMKERIERLTGSRLPYAGTFHSICARILRIHGKYIGLDPNFVIYDSDDQMSLIKDIYKENGFDANTYRPNSVKGVISKAKNELISLNDFVESAVGDFATFAAKVFKLYERRLKEAQAVDFDDLMVKVVQLMKLDPQIREYYQRQFQHVLVDEYQDTNKAQYVLTQYWTEPQNNLYVVGDFSQSIYAWRGADYRNMLQLKTDYPNIKEYRLEQNYRSTQSILDAATSVISKNTSHPILQLWTENTMGAQLTCFELSSGELESLRIIDEIRRYRDREQVPLDQIAILYRTNAQSRLFEEALIRYGIPYRLIGGTKFYERKEIKDVLAYARLLTNPQDSVSYKRALGLGKRRMDVFETWRASLQPEVVASTPAAKLLRSILEITEYLSKYNQDVPEDQERLENVAELISMAAQFKSLTQFLENVALLQDNYFVDEANPVGNAKRLGVNLMSLHAAKGLEFHVVFLAGMEDGLLPHSNSLFDYNGIEEERRLCYVGITRAKQHLYFSFARSRFQYGIRRSSIPSRFLSDIPNELLKVESDLGESQLEQSHTKKGRRLVVDEDLADAVLKGELDLEVFLDS
jgi:DNA helicase-2/ATP-dependent DNA helicase PcrA